jgi:uncharacterized protein (UPF0333 family)
MFQSNKGQTSIEFIILVGILLLIGFYFIGAIYMTFDSSYAIYKIKNRTLQVISSNDSEDVLYKVSYQIQDTNLILRLDLKKQNLTDYTLSSSDYVRDINDILARTKFTNVLMDFKYTS